MDNTPVTLNEPPARKLIHEATAEELARFAERGLGLNMSGITEHAAVVAKMNEAGFIADDIPILRDRSAEGQVSGYLRAAASGRTFWRKEQWRDAENHTFKWREYAMIQIPNQPTPGGKDPVQPNVNGRRAQIKRGQPVAVPVEYVEALQNAVEIEWESDLERGLKEPREVQRYPFSYLPVPEGEIITPPEDALTERQAALTPKSKEAA